MNLMGSFKDKIYQHYVTYHNAHISEIGSLAKFERRFFINDYYYGSFLPPNLNAKILDIGCGEGNLVFWLQSKGYNNVTGIDLSNEQITLGKKLGIDGLVCTDLIMYLKECVSEYDLIIAKDVFEHFGRQEFFDCLQLIHNALREKGTLLLQLPNGQGLFYTSIYYADITHEMAYTHSSLRQLVLSAGYKAITCFPVNPVSKGVKGMVRTYLWKLKVLQLKFWKMVETGNASGIFTSNLIALVEK